MTEKFEAKASKIKTSQEAKHLLNMTYNVKSFPTNDSVFNFHFLAAFERLIPEECLSYDEFDPTMFLNTGRVILRKGHINCFINTDGVECKMTPVSEDTDITEDVIQTTLAEMRKYLNLLTDKYIH